MGGAVANWSLAWFARPRAHLASVRPIKPGAKGFGATAEWRSPRAGLAIGCPPRVLSRLRDWALDLEPGEAPAAPSPLEARILADFEMRILNDLVQRIEEALGAPGALSWAGDTPEDGGGLFSVAEDNGAPLLSFVVCFQVLEGICRRSLPRPHKNRPRLVALKSAIAAQGVTIQASLGEVQISLDELAELTVGDVLVLKRAVDDTAEIRLAGAQSPLAVARLTQTDGRIALSIP